MNGPITARAPRAEVTPGKEEETGGAPHAGWLSQQWQLIKAAIAAWSDDYAPSMGAALSYYTLFSLAPLLIIVIAVAGMLFGQDAAQGAIVEQLRGIMGEDGAVAVEGMLKTVRGTGKNVIATIVGTVVLLLGATAVFGELQSALDRIWRTPAPKKESGLWHRDSFLNQGAEPVTDTPEEFAAIVRADVAKWAMIVKATGAKPN